MQPHARSNPTLRVGDLDELRIRRTLCRTAGLVVEAEFGNRGLRGRKRVFEPEAGRNPVIVKLMEVLENDVDKIHQEFNVNSSLAAKDPDFEIIVPTYCFSHARWMTAEQGEDGNHWVDTGRLRAIIMPAHIPFTTAMSSSTFSPDMMKQLWRSGFDKILQFHDKFSYVHRDIKAENMVVKAEWRNGELKPVEPLQARIIDVVTALSDEPGGMGIGAMLGVFDGTITYVPMCIALNWMRETFNRCAAVNPYLAGPLPPKPNKLAQPSSDPVQQAAKEPEVLYDEMGEVYVPKFSREEVIGGNRILGYLCSPNPARDNDVWAWGISLLKGHDPDYVRGTCYRTSDLFTFQDTFPLYGPTGSYKDLITAVDGLQKRFSPIYDHQTYKAEGSKVPKEFFPVLDLLLGRSKGTQCFAVDPEGALPDHLKALQFPVPMEPTSASSTPPIDPIPSGPSQTSAPGTQYATATSNGEGNPPQVGSKGKAVKAIEASVCERKAMASFMHGCIDFLVPPTTSKTEDGDSILWLTRLICPLNGCDTGKDGGSWETYDWNKYVAHVTVETARKKPCKAVQSGGGSAVDTIRLLDADGKVLRSWNALGH